MASEQQIAANRHNARLSTGPRTREGKALAGQNAITHGLRANRGLLAGESPEEFLEMRQSVFDELAPEGPIESELADRVVSVFWRLRRIPAFEAAVLAWVQARECSQSSYRIGDPCLAGDLRAAPSSDHRDDRELILGRSLDAFLTNDLSGKLGRYETSLQRQLAALFRELRVMQARKTTAAPRRGGWHVLEQVTPSPANEPA